MDAPRTSHRRFHCALAIAAVLCMAAVGVTAQTDPATRAIMSRAYDALAYLLPVSIRDPDVGTPWDQELIDDHVGALQAASRALVTHTQGMEAEIGLLARSFERTVTDLETSLDREWPAYAYFLVMDLTQYCVACHSRLPAESRAAFAPRLFARLDVDALEPEVLANLYVATREFDAAAAAYERILLDPAADPVDADFDGTYLNYLNLRVTIQRDPQRARQFFARLSNRSDLPFYLAERVRRWSGVMEELADVFDAAPTLTQARQLYAAAGRLSLVPYRHEGAVHDLLAAGMLRSLVAGQSLSGDALAEAYFMLGVITLRTIEPRPPVPDMELLMESAIRTAPKGPFARDAYAILEEFGAANSVGLRLLDGSNAPSPIVDLDALRALLEE